MKKNVHYYGNTKIKQLPSGSYNVRLNDTPDPVTGKQRWHSITGKTVKEVIQKANEWTTTQESSSHLTLRKAIQEYIDTCDIAEYSPATILGYTSILRNALGDLGNMRIDRIQLTDVQRQINIRAKDHSVKTVGNEFGLISRVMSIYAPSLKLDKIVLPTKKNKVNEDAGIEIPTDEQVIELMQAAKAKDIELYKAILIDSQTGLRRSQICALTWEDINLRMRTITISKAVVYGIDNDLHLKAPKSAAGDRTIRISTELARILEQYKQPSGHVIDLSPDKITLRFYRLRKKLGIPGTFHDLRHYHASILIAANIPDKYAMADMGQSTPYLYKKVYGHMFPQKTQQMYDILNDHSNSVLSQHEELEQAK